MHLLLEIFECTPEKTGNIFLKEFFIGCSGRRLFWGVDGILNLARFNEVEHARQEHCLTFESWTENVSYC